MARLSLPRFRARWLAALALPLVWSACADSATEPISGPDLDFAVAPGQDAAYARAAAVQDRHTPALFARGGIVGTGVGTNADGEHVIRVYMVRPGPHALPATLDGVPVEAVTTGLIMAGNVNDPTTRERPAPNGFSIGHPDITAGTLGALVKNGSGALFILSNNHVIANSNNASIGDPTLQPGPFDGGTSADQIGTLADFVPISFSSNNTVDAAIASVSGGNVTGATPSYAYGAPGTTTANAFVGQSVQKFGRTTGHTTGTVAETNVTVDVCYEARGPFMCASIARFVNQITISDGTFSDGGDSGSLIVTNNGTRNPVGLLFAGSSTRTIANPIDDVLSAFGVSITTDPGSGSGGNNAPSASFTASCTDLTCSFDAGGSSDGDGSIVSYAWTFGDGNGDSGVTTSHTYGAGGTYTVVLTVTDDDGATDTASQDVTVTAGGTFALAVQGYKSRGFQKADLSWNGASGSDVDVFRDGNLIATTANDGFFTDNIDQRGGGSYTYQLCEAGTATCSNSVTITF